MGKVGQLWLGVRPILCSCSPQFYPAIFITYLNVRVAVQLNFILKSVFLYRVHLGNDSANKSDRWSGAGC